MQPGSQDWVTRLRDPADRSASGDFAAAWLPDLVAFLTRPHLTTDEALVQEASGTAIIDFLKAPDRFDPSKRSLEGYLRMAAEGDLRNAIERDARRRRREVSFPVELDPAAGNESDDERPRLDDFPELVAVRDALPEADRAVFELIEAGVRATAPYAELLGLAGLPPDEQAAAVKRAKERILKRFQRAARPPRAS
jgi:DNA-directed RNA polymerase specialized sigma24 family protein